MVKLDFIIVRQIQTSGTIETTTVDVAARAPGTIDTINIQVGASVSAGQLLAILSRNDLEAQKERDAKAVAVAEAKLEDLRLGAREQEISEAVNNVTAAQVNLDKANQDLQRAESLAKEGALPQ